MVSSGCGPVAFVDDDRDIRPEVRGRALDQPNDQLAAGARLDHTRAHHALDLRAVGLAQRRDLIGGRGAMPGVKTTRKVKGMGCATLKTLLENDMLILNDDVMINELGTFIAVGTSYEADKGCHDDTVMTLVLFSWFINTDFFKDEYSSDVREDVYANHVARIMDTLSPLGVMPFEENDPAAEQVEVVGGMKVTTGFDLASWMAS